MKSIFAFSFLSLLLITISCRSQEKRVQLRILNDQLNDIISSKSQIKELDKEFQFTEGPLWSVDGYWLFSDIPANTIYKVDENLNITTFRVPSNNSNGLSFDKNKNLIICEHGSRSLGMLLADGKTYKTLIDNFEGKKFNSPNDLCITKEGKIIFTDPCWGLSGFENSKDKEVLQNGVYILNNNEISIIDEKLFRPNGVTLSPDEKTLYVAEWFKNNDEPKTKVYIKYRWEKSDIGEVFNFDKIVEIDRPQIPIFAKPGGFDGMKTDIEGNIYCAGQDGIYVFNKEDLFLGVILFPNHITNLTWGGKDFKTLMITMAERIFFIDCLIQGK